jgi:hypothetical protein
MSGLVWNKKRKWMGNLIPSIPFGTLYTLGLFFAVFAPKSLQWITFPALAMALIGGWKGIDLYGFWETEKMRAELEESLKSQGIAIEPTDRWVGISWKGGTSALDAHLDVGFLRITPSGVKVFGELDTYEVSWQSITHFGWTPGMHTIMGLGGWCTLKYNTESGSKILKFEVREKPTMLGNKPLTKELVDQLWDACLEARKQKGPAGANSHQAV